MDSLLANYGSDDEEDEGPQEPPPRTRPPLFNSLPPPKLSGEGPAPRSTLFASLPPPKLAGGFSVSEERIRDTSKGNTASHRDAGDALETEESLTTVPDGTRWKDAVPHGDTAPSGVSTSNRASLFSSLPPPKNTGSSLQSLPLPGLPSKRVVQLRPNIDMTLLKDLDDDVQPKAKQQATEVARSGKATGLAAILPKPKYTGSTLGSGYAPGHRATVDVGTMASPSVAMSSELAPGSVHEPSSFSIQHSPDTGNSYEHFGGSHMNVPLEAREGYNQDVGADVHTHDDAVQLNAPSYQSDFVSRESAEVLCPEGYYVVPDDYSEGMLAYEASSDTISTAQDPLADLLLKERRKGGKNASLNIIEVKQADLTATKLREDQLRATGIAFGPAYRPSSSNKDKPSKLHRRKHQIGSLYFDMKQKEMELLERRAKGNMTKAQTQGKYGW